MPLSVQLRVGRERVNEMPVNAQAELAMRLLVQEQLKRGLWTLMAPAYSNLLCFPPLKIATGLPLPCLAASKPFGPRKPLKEIAVSFLLLYSLSNYIFVLENVLNSWHSLTQKNNPGLM